MVLWWCMTFMAQSRKPCQWDRSVLNYFVSWKDWKRRHDACMFVKHHSLTTSSQLEAHLQGAPKISYPLVLRTSTILNLVVRNPRVFVQKVLLKTQKQSGIYFTAYYHIISLFAGKQNCTAVFSLVTFVNQCFLIQWLQLSYRKFPMLFDQVRQLAMIEFPFPS